MATVRKLIIVLAFATAVASSQGIYVSRHGYVASLSALSAITDLGAGDSILFPRGGYFEGGITFDGYNGGVFIGAYGTGAKPVLTRRDTIPGWSTSGNWVKTSGHLWRFSIGHKARRIWNGTREFRQVYDTLASTDPDYGNPTIGLTANYQFWSRKDGYIWVYCSTDQPWSYYGNPLYSGPQTTSDDWGYSVFDLRNISGVTIRDLHIEGGEFTAVYLWNVDDAVLDSLDFRYTNQTFRAAYGSDYGIMRNCTFQSMDTVQHDYEAPASSSDGQAYNTDHATIYKSNHWDVHDCLFVGASHDAINCHGTGLAATTDCANYNTIHDCEIWGGGVDYTRGIETLNASGTLSGVCSYNEFYRLYIHGTTEWSQFMGDHNRMYYVVIDTVRRSWKPNGYQAGGVNMGGFETSHRNRIENCYIGNAASGGVVIVYGGAGDSNIVQNCILVNCGTDEGTKQGMRGASLVIDGSSTSLHVIAKNNLCYSTLTDSPYVYRQDYYATSPVSKLTGAQFNTADAYSDILSGNLSASPGVNSDYTLTPGSPAIDAGVATLYGMDYFGVSVPYNSTTDIGVSEYVPAATGGKFVTVAGAGAHTGEDLSNAWTLAEANAGAIAGDTVRLSTGTYPSSIDPANFGSYANPIVYMPAPGAACSLYVYGVPINITTGYIIVRGIAAQSVRASGLPPVEITGSTGNNAIISCRLYGGTYDNGAHDGTYYSVGIHDSPYNRIMDNLVDRQDAATTSDDYRGNGIELFGSGAKYNIVEGNRIKNVSHFAYTVGLGPTYNIARNNEIWNVHGGLELQNGVQHHLLEGNKVRSPDMVCLNRNGAAVELYGRYNIMRYCQIAQDTSIAVTLYMTDRTTEIIVNCDATGHAWGDVCNPVLTDLDGRYYHNSFTAAATYPNGGSTQWKFAVGELDAGLNNEFGHHVWLGNIFSESTDTTLFYYQNTATPDPDPTDTARANLWWRGSPNRNVITALTDNHTGVYGLEDAKATFPSWIEESNIEASPLLVDSISRGAFRSSEISGLSPCRDNSVCLTRVATSTTGTIVDVGDALYFHYNWGGSPYDRGDSIYIMHAGSFVKRELDSVDYVNHRLIFTASVTVSAGDSIYVGGTFNTLTGTYTNRLQGRRPDIGPYEIGAGTPDPPPSVPDTTENLHPENGSTQAQPIIFRWRVVAGATQYHLTASYDGWVHDHVSVVQADTQYTYSGFPVDTLVIWNVRAGNAAGWGAWNSVYSFRTQGVVTYTDTITVNWNKVSDSKSMTGNTVVQMVNIRSRDNILIIKNPFGKLVDWPANVTWLGTDVAPQPAAGGTSAYWFVRDSVSRVLGVDLSRVADVGGVTASWVRLMIAESFINGSINSVVVGDSVKFSSQDPASITTDQSSNLVLSDVFGSYSLSQLAAGGSGVADGQDADSLWHLPISPYRPATGKSVLTHDPDSAGYRHVAIMGMDSAGAGNGEGKKLTIVNGQIVVRNDSVGAGGSADSSVFATKFFTNSTYAPLAHSHAGSYVGVGDTAGMMRRSDSSWFMSKAYADDYLPLTGGSLSGPLGVTGDVTATTFTKAPSDSIGSSGVAGNRYTWWINTNMKVRMGIGVTGTLSLIRYWPDGGIGTIYSTTKASIKNSWVGIHEYDTVNVTKSLTVGAVGAEKRVMTSTDSASARTYSDARYKLRTSADSASLVIVMAGTSWLATTNTDSMSGPILFPKYFVVDSVMVALAGTASTDTVKVDVRYGPDYSAAGTAVVTTPAQIAASGLWTRTVPNSATIPAFNSVWVKVTKKVGSSKRLTVMLKGRWQ